jgi:hypothetical protein
MNAWSESKGTAGKRDLFILHASAEPDTCFVHSYLVPALRLAPDRVLLSSGLPPGQRLFDAVESALAISRMTVLILTPAFLRESWTSYGEALASYQATCYGRSLVPALLSSCELPARLKMWVPLDLRDPAGRDRELSRLRDVLHVPPVESVSKAMISVPGDRPACRSTRLRRQAVRVGLASIMALIPAAISSTTREPGPDPAMEQSFAGSTPALTPSVGTSPAGMPLGPSAYAFALQARLAALPMPVDVGISDVFATSCIASYVPRATIGEYLGPVQPMTFVVPTTSKERSISAEMGRVVFGRGSNDLQASPFTDPLLYFVRNSTSGTQQMISRAINVDAKQWWGVDRGGSSAVRNLLLSVDPARVNNAVGILSSDFADAERARLRILAFRARNQSCGYYPDSSVFTRDKRAVRDGH